MGKAKMVQGPNPRIRGRESPKKHFGAESNRNAGQCAEKGPLESCD